MKAYSEDLRRKIVEALDRGTNKSQAARLFGVSLSSIKRYAKMACEGRSLAPRRAPGKRSKVDENGRRLVEADLKERPAATLTERCEFLEKILGVKVSESTMCRLLKRLGWSRKKDQWTLARGTSGLGQRGARWSVRWIQSGWSS